MMTRTNGSTVASVETGHWFATPFAALFTFGYGYVASLVAKEQVARVRESRRAAQLAGAQTNDGTASDSLPPPEAIENDTELAA